MITANPQWLEACERMGRGDFYEHRAYMQMFREARRNLRKKQKEWGVTTISVESNPDEKMHLYYGDGTCVTLRGEDAIKRWAAGNYTESIIND